MTKPISRRMAVDAILYRMAEWHQFHIECYLCYKHLEAGQEIDFDHAHAIVHEGPHEYQNLRPVHRECHKEKTKRDVQANAKIKRITGETKGPPKRDWPSRPMKSSGKLQSRPFPKKAKT